MSAGGSGARFGVWRNPKSPMLESALEEEEFKMWGKEIEVGTAGWGAAGGVKRVFMLNKDFTVGQLDGLYQCPVSEMVDFIEICDFMEMCWDESSDWDEMQLSMFCNSKAVELRKKLFSSRNFFVSNLEKLHRYGGVFIDIQADLKRALDKDDTLLKRILPELRGLEKEMFKFAILQSNASFRTQVIDMLLSFVEELRARAAAYDNALHAAMDSGGMDDLDKMRVFYKLFKEANSTGGFSWTFRNKVFLRDDAGALVGTRIQLRDIGAVFYSFRKTFEMACSPLRRAGEVAAKENAIWMAKEVAVCMAKHERLGQGSALSVLEEDSLRMILQLSCV